VFRFCTENSIEEKVIEKAYKKLRLDALVIQQGRLTDNATTKVRAAHGPAAPALPSSGLGRVGRGARRPRGSLQDMPCQPRRHIAAHP
jgi:hypothetical protein